MQAKQLGLKTEEIRKGDASMDYVRLVNDENTPIYKKENLRDDDFEFFDGLEHGLTLVDNWFANQEFDEKSVLEMIRKECVEDAIEELKDWIYTTICQYMVETIDNYEDVEPVDVINTTCPTTL